jgi:hypothetical protein
MSSIYVKIERCFWQIDDRNEFKHHSTDGVLCVKEEQRAGHKITLGKGL